VFRRIERRGGSAMRDCDLIWFAALLGGWRSRSAGSPQSATRLHLYTHPPVASMAADQWSPDKRNSRSTEMTLQMTGNACKPVDSSTSHDPKEAFWCSKLVQ
jgi:hypothetical protein